MCAPGKAGQGSRTPRCVLPPAGQGCEVAAGTLSHNTPLGLQVLLQLEMPQNEEGVPGGSVW